MKKINKEKYRFKKYDDKFILLFKKERAILRKIIPNLEIEHVGSTSVPGLGGKGIIDIAIKTNTIEANKIVNKLESIGFESDLEHLRNNNSTYLKKIIKYKGKERRVHVHLTLNNKFWNSFIVFRDYLKSNKKERDRYNEIKKKASFYAKGEANKYRAYKKPLIEEIMKKALKKIKK